MQIKKGKKAQRKDFPAQRSRKGAAYPNRTLLDNCTTPAKFSGKKPNKSEACLYPLPGKAEWGRTLHAHLAGMKTLLPTSWVGQRRPSEEPGLPPSHGGNEAFCCGVSGGHVGSSNKAPLLLEYQEAKEKPEFPLPPDSNQAVSHLP